MSRAGRRPGAAAVVVLAAVPVLAAQEPLPPRAVSPVRPFVAVVDSASWATPPVATQAWVSAFAAGGYPTHRIAPDVLDHDRSAVVVVPRLEAEQLTGEQVGTLVLRVEAGGWLVTCGDTPLSRALGARFGARRTRVVGVQDEGAPGLEIRWQWPVLVPALEPPEGAIDLVGSSEGDQPLVVGFRRGRGAVLLLAIEIDDESTLGYSRFPYLLTAVERVLGVTPWLALPRLAAYADMADHRDADPETLAQSWHEAGIREVHVGAWDAFDANDRLFSRLIAACHRWAISVYAWLELPEVSEAFWAEHPAWREKTAGGADAHVDWRKLMALDDPACFEAVAGGLEAMLDRFDWDGVDVAELYYESPLGLDAWQRLTPMNEHIRRAFARFGGVDPREIFEPASAHYFKRDRAALDDFLDFRRARIVALHERLLSVLDAARRRKPHLDVVVTLVDALYDATMRDAIAIDTSGITSLLPRHGARLQIEDPFTLWGLGPERYLRIAHDYEQLAPPGRPLAVDINVVPREHAFPTAQQTGLELLQLIAESHRGFGIVCLYSEASVFPQDRPRLARALAATSRVEPLPGGALEVTTPDGLEVDTGEGDRTAWLDGREWPCVRGRVVLVPRGSHRLSWSAGATADPRARLLDCNATLLAAAEHPGALEVHYTSVARAMLRVSSRPGAVSLDGAPIAAAIVEGVASFTVVAPPGEHVVTLSYPH